MAPTDDAGDVDVAGTGEGGAAADGPAAEGVAADGAQTGEWRRLPIFMSKLDGLKGEHIVDVLKFRLVPKRLTLPIKQRASTSTEAMEARDALKADPYNMFLINELAYRYIVDGQRDRCANCMLWGWKRFGEIPDAGVQFCFLMKLCEVSYCQGLFKQAQAVLQDVTEPTDRDLLKAYLILSCYVHAANKEGSRSLAAFQRAVEGEEFVLAVRILALVSLDLKQVGVFEIARNAVQQKAPEVDPEAALTMLDNFVHSAQEREVEKTTTDKYIRWIWYAVIFLSCLVVFFTLYIAEQWSLAKWRAHRMMENASK